MDDRIKKILEKVFNKNFNDYELKDLNSDNVEEWDSLSHLKIIIALEEEFGIEIEPEEIYLMKNGAEEIKKIIEKKQIES